MKRTICKHNWTKSLSKISLITKGNVNSHPPSSIKNVKPKTYEKRKPPTHSLNS